MIARDCNSLKTQKSHVKLGKLNLSLSTFCLKHSDPGSKFYNFTYYFLNLLRFFYFAKYCRTYKCVSARANLSASLILKEKSNKKFNLGVYECFELFYNFTCNHFVHYAWKHLVKMQQITKKRIRSIHEEKKRDKLKSTFFEIFLS